MGQVDKVLARELTIGRVAERTGVAVSAIRFYEERGLVLAHRNAGGQRRFDRAVIRRVSFIRIAQKFGLSLEQIRVMLAGLPDGRTPTFEDWSAISRDLRAHLDQRIEALSVMRDRLDGCIGCGCLSLDRCALYNPNDAAAEAGSGPRYLLGDDPIGGRVQGVSTA